MLRSISLGCGAHGKVAGISASTSRLRRDGDLAVLVRDRGHPRIAARDQGKASSLALQTLGEALTAFDRQPRDLARRLLDHFGSIAGLSNAQDEELRQLESPDESWADKLIGARRIFLTGAFDQILQTRFEASREPLYRYLACTLGGLRHERVLAIFLDAEGMVICEQTMAEGETGEVTLPLRLIVGRALSVGARSVVLAHNHPSGYIEPSKTDIRNTRRLKRAMRDLEIDLVDHLIVSRGQVASMRDGGVL